MSKYTVGSRHKVNSDDWFPEGTIVEVTKVSRNGTLECADVSGNINTTYLYFEGDLNPLTPEESEHTEEISKEELESAEVGPVRCDSLNEVDRRLKDLNDMLLMTASDYYYSELDEHEFIISIHSLMSRKDEIEQLKSEGLL